MSPMVPCCDISCNGGQTVVLRATLIAQLIPVFFEAPPVTSPTLPPGMRDPG